MSLTQAAYFYALKDIKPTATAWVSGNTPKASHLEPEQRVVPLFLIVLNLSVMSNEKNFEKRIAEKSAAHMLMTNWVKENTDRVANVLEDLIPFMIGECELDELNTSLNVVNTTFASIALEVIKASRDKDNTLCLPMDATQMQNALFNLNKFLRRLERLDLMFQQYKDNPAFKMCQTAFEEAEIYGG